MSEPAILALQDGTVFHGRAIGASGRAVGEVIFNTAMSGYQEILTDPSYARQLVCLTYPHIGNVGANPADAEAPGIMAAGLIVRDYAMAASNYRADCSLSEYLKSQSVVGIADVDTRRLTRHLREHGAMAGCIATGADLSPDEAVAAARDFPGLAGMDLAREVTTETPYEWLEGSYDLDEAAFASRDSRHHVVAYDFGVKRNILRMLADRGCRVTVVPATTPASEVRNMAPDGVFLSNGPGDPEPCDYAIEAISELITGEAPVFGICLGHQLLGLAAGARTMKMKFGHHGANHPVKDLDSERVFITSQNHGFALDESSLPKRIRVTHRSLFDDTIQGIELQDAPAFSFQGHPEASPGPHDLGELFDRFVEMMEQRHA